MPPPFERGLVEDFHLSQSLCDHIPVNVLMVVLWLTCNTQGKLANRNYRELGRYNYLGLAPHLPPHTLPKRVIWDTRCAWGEAPAEEIEREEQESAEPWHLCASTALVCRGAGAQPCARGSRLARRALRAASTKASFLERSKNVSTRIIRN